MKILLLIYFSTIVVMSVVHLSLLKGKRIQWIAILIPALSCLCFYKFSLQQNNTTLDWLLAQENLVSGIAMLLTFEAILIIFLTVVQIKSYYHIKYPLLWKWISVLPSIQLIIALVFFQTYVFLKVDGHSFSVLALLFFLGSSIILAVLTIAMQTVLKKWSARAELKALTAFFQLLLAMFLPLIAKGKKVSFTQITLDFSSIAIVALVVIGISSLGYIRYIIKNKQTQ